MTTLGELKAYIAKQEEAGHLYDNTPVVLGNTHEALGTMGLFLERNRVALWLSPRIYTEAYLKKPTCVDPRYGA